MSGSTARQCDRALRRAAALAGRWSQLGPAGSEGAKNWNLIIGRWGLDSSTSSSRFVPRCQVWKWISTAVPGVRSHCRFKIRGTEYVSESGLKLTGERSYKATMRPSPSGALARRRGEQALRQAHAAA
jgi:hypothetical protein